MPIGQQAPAPKSRGRRDRPESTTAGLRPRGEPGRGPDGGFIPAASSATSDPAEARATGSHLDDLLFHSTISIGAVGIVKCGINIVMLFISTTVKHDITEFLKLPGRALAIGQPVTT
jgi:hypothetical protein